MIAYVIKDINKLIGTVRPVIPVAQQQGGITQYTRKQGNGLCK